MLRSLVLSLLVASSALATASAFAHGDISKVNSSIRIDSGETVGELNTVNGSIRLGDNVQASEVSTVNGSIDIGDNASVESADTVNGRITIGSHTRVSRDVETVNGSVDLEEASDVSGDVANVNGDIRLRSAHVGGRIQTVSGDIEIGADSIVDGGILVEKSNNWFNFGSSKPPRIVIGPRAVVKGSLDFEREVELLVSDSASIGAVRGATPVKFSGENP
jgi:DUF4097 and DUF4098 domain-containing protein YvlB